MHLHGPDLILSATDLSNFLSCRHRTALDMAMTYGERARPHSDHDPLLELLWQRGRDHEQRYVDSLRAEGRTVAELSSFGKPEEIIALTLEEMHKGTDTIVQGSLSDGRWFGRPDVMRRVEAPSTLGSWSYEISDTKLARETKAGTILQLGLYSEMLAVAQGVRPEHFYVVTPDAASPVETYRVDDYAAYFRLVRGHMMATVAKTHADVAAENYPDPVDHCEICHWQASCRERRRADDHLSLVAGITRAQRRELEARSVETLTSLAGVPVPLTFKPGRGSMETYVRVREQARLQLASRGKRPPLHEILPVEAGKGLCRLPDPSPGDLFLDLEGDQYAVEGGREYLFGVASTDGSYRLAWAFSDSDERRAFEWVMDTVAEAIRAHPEMHIYHYAPYEPTAFKRLMGKYATRERELDAMLRAGRFVDLLAVVRQGVRAGVESYSIKRLEPLYEFEREVPLENANRCLPLMAYGLESGRPETVGAEIRDVIEGYNRDDCISTLRLRDWLERVRAQVVASGTGVPRRILDDGSAPPDVDERARSVETLRSRLLAGVPETRTERNAEQQGRWLLAYMLDYHRREDKASWFTFFERCDAVEDDLLDERDSIAGMRFVERLGPVIGKNGKPTRSVVDRYCYPPQEVEIERKADLHTQDKNRFGEVVSIDRVHRTIDIQKGPSRCDLHPSAVFAFKFISSEEMEGALARIGDSVATGNRMYGAARALLAGDAPRIRSGAFSKADDETESDFAIRIVGELDETVLPIQGPPGAGKTFCGARMICELVRQGKKVGITATGHKVIRLLLDAVADEAKVSRTGVRLAHRENGDEKPDEPSQVKSLGDNDSALLALQSGEVNVVGGTSWLWSRPEFASAVDVLFVDEAGQMSLANVIAVSQAANSVVLLGDPQQLEQPRKGSHPDGVGLSALEHVLAGSRTIAPDRGIFLPETWRLCPSICTFTSEVFYDNRLGARAGLDRQQIAGVDDLPNYGLAVLAVEHDGNRNYSTEEVERVAQLVASLTTNGATWKNSDGALNLLTGADVLVVAPYNAQVTRLSERLAGTGARVGTVDKFQGQQAPVVIYSMATSRPEDAPRGMEFLYSLNRLNVAISRARCVAILVASPRLFEPECRSPRQMKLANALCRFRELAGAVVAAQQMREF